MAKYTFSTYTASTNYISLLDDEPNDVGGITAGEFKAKFDQSPTELKAFVNNLLIPSIQNHYATTSDIVSITQGAVADGSITEAKLAFDVATQAELNAFTASINGTASTIVTNLSNHTASTSYQHFNMMTMSGSIVQMGASTPSVLLPGGARKNLSINATNDLIVHTDSLQSILTTAGDTLYASSANTPARLGKGSAYQGLLMNSGETSPAWGNVMIGGKQVYTTGTNTFTAPKTGEYRVTVVGGGGGGVTGCTYGNSQGGGGGMAVGYVTLTKGTEYSAVVGAGGTLTNNTSPTGGTGGTSSFGGISASGGSGATGGASNTNYAGGSGGAGSGGSLNLAGAQGDTWYYQASVRCGPSGMSPLDANYGRGGYQSNAGTGGIVFIEW